MQLPFGRQPRLYFTIGAQRSGKTTLARKWLHREVHFEHDDNFPRYLWDSDFLRLELYRQRYCRAGEPMIFAMKHYAIAASLRAGHDVIVAGTHTSRTSIQRILEIDPTAKPILVDTPEEVCLQRAIDTGQTDLLPVISRICRRIEKIKKIGLDNYISEILEDMEKGE